MLPSRCQHIGIFVEDIEKTARFYIEKLGFKLNRDYTAKKDMMRDIFGVNSSCRIKFLLLDGFGIELFQFDTVPLGKKTVRTLGYNHWTIMVEDKERFCRNLQRQKIKVTKIRKPHGFTFFIEDPESNLIEVKSFDAPNSDTKRY